MSASGRRSRRDAGQMRNAGRAWSAEEEAAFEAALAAHGRDWKACADYVGTRDARAIASHAQKHFIKLAMSGQALPAQVAASGAGYTLSGRPLDVNSAAARAYGFRPEHMQRAWLGSGMAADCVLRASMQVHTALSTGQAAAAGRRDGACMQPGVWGRLGRWACREMHWHACRQCLRNRALVCMWL